MKEKISGHIKVSQQRHGGTLSPNFTIIDTANFNENLQDREKDLINMTNNVVDMNPYSDQKKILNICGEDFQGRRIVTVSGVRFPQKKEFDLNLLR